MTVDSHSSTNTSCERTLRMVHTRKPASSPHPEHSLSFSPNPRPALPAPSNLHPTRIHPELHRILLHSRSSQELYAQLLTMLTLERSAGNDVAPGGDSKVREEFTALLADTVGKLADAGFSLRSRAALIGILQEVSLEDAPAFLTALALWLGDQLQGGLEASALDPDLRASCAGLLAAHREAQAFWRSTSGSVEAAALRVGAGGAAPVRLRAVGRSV